MPTTKPTGRPRRRPRPSPAGFSTNLAPWVLALAALLPTAGAHAQPAPSVAGQNFDIPAGALAPALTRFVEVSGLRLLAPAELLRGRSTRGVQGRLPASQALDRLLAGTGLVQRVTVGGTVTVEALPPPAPPTPGSPSAESAAPDVTSFATVTVTASQLRPDPVYETAGSASVVNREAIDRLPPRNASDVLVDVAGVYTANDRQNPALAVNIRGMQDFGRVNVTIDGARQNYQQTGHGNNGSVYLDPELLSGADVTKGPVSTVGGAGVIAGVVNFRTLDADDLLGKDQQAGGRANLTTGSNAYHFAGSAVGAWRANEALDLVAGISHKKVGAFDAGQHGSTPLDEQQYLVGPPDEVHYSGQDQWSGLLKATARIAPGHELKLGYIGFDAKFDTGSGTLASNGTGPAVGTANHVRTDTVTANHSWLNGSDWVDLQTNIYYTRTRNQQMPFSGTTASDIETDNQTATFGGSIANTSRFALPGLAAALTYGGEYVHDKTRARSDAGSASDPSLSVGATPEGTRTLSSAFTSLKLERGDWLELTGGLRYDRYEIEGGGNLYNGQIDNGVGTNPRYTSVFTPVTLQRHGGRMLPSLGAAIKPTPDWQLYTQWGRGSRPPAITESLMSGTHPGITFPLLPNPYLLPERSTSWEVGSSLKREGLFTPKDRARLKLAWFNNQVDDYMMMARVMAPGDTQEQAYRYAFVNLQDRVRFRGLELQADYDAGTAFAGFNLTRTLSDLGDARYDPFPFGSTTGYPATTQAGTKAGLIFFQLPPRTKYALSGGVRLLDRKLTLGARWQFSSGLPLPIADYGIVNSWSAYHVVDLWAAWEVSRALTLRLALQNLRDRRYAEPMGNQLYLAPGRSALLSATFKF